MERILNDEEKIRRAEEIYYRRNNKIASPHKKEEKKSNSIKDKILFNLLVMLNLAIIVFCIQNKGYIFTKEFMDSLDKYNENINSKVINVINFFINEKKIENNSIEENNEEIKNEENVIENDNNELVNMIENSIVKNENSTSSINEMELDIQNLKGAYKFVAPLTSGIMSSEFGARESKYQNVTGYHTGIDIAAEEGTSIVAAMQGIVEEVSSEGDYGKHIKIRCNNVYTLYAHCSKIFVVEGQIVAEGQKIANVGNTGNSTGPHLHFEIRVNDRYIDPAKIIEF